MKKPSPKRVRRRHHRAALLGPEREIIDAGNNYEELVCGHVLDTLLTKDGKRCYPNFRRCSICLLLEGAM